MVKVEIQAQTAKHVITAPLQAQICPENSGSTLTLPKKQRFKNAAFRFLKHSINPEYEQGVKSLPLRTCLIHNKAPVLYVKTEPKWHTDLWVDIYEPETGEITGSEIYRTNDLKAGNNRKIKAVNKFCDAFNPYYKSRKMSLLFYTLTLANQSNSNIKNAINNLKKRLKRNGLTLYGFLWVSEISDDLHWHYHLCISVNRLNLKGKQLPEFLKMDGLWGTRTQVEFVKKDIRWYMAKYFVKNNSRIIGKRAYGLKINSDITTKKQ